MKQGNIKRIIEKNIRSKSLSKNQLDSLLQQQQNHSAAYKYKLRHLSAVFAALFIGMLLTTLLSTDLPIEEKIGSEVAKNHIKLKPLEVATSQLSELRQYFTELDFSPIASQHVNFSEQTLVGGRYCSIQGITAAQIRLKDKNSGQLQSLYQTIYDRKKFSGIPLLSDKQKPVTVHANGVTVDIWVEKDLLFALTKD